MSTKLTLESFTTQDKLDYLNEFGLWVDPDGDLTPLELVTFCDGIIEANEVNLLEIDAFLKQRSDERSTVREEADPEIVESSPASVRIGPGVEQNEEAAGVRSLNMFKSLMGGHVPTQEIRPVPGPQPIGEYSEGPHQIPSTTLGVVHDLSITPDEIHRRIFVEMRHTLENTNEGEMTRVTLDFSTQGVGCYTLSSVLKVLHEFKEVRQYSISNTIGTSCQVEIQLGHTSTGPVTRYETYNLMIKLP